MLKRLVFGIAILILIVSGCSPPAEKTLKPPGKEVAVPPPLIEGSEYLKAGYYVMAASEDTLYARGPEKSKTVYFSKDYGDTWEPIITFEKRPYNIHVTPKGIILISISSGSYQSPGDGELWYSKDGKNFKLVLKFAAGVAERWNIASDQDGYVFISEYGHKKANNNARRIYRSKDSGATWEIVYEPPEIDNYHNHKILIDNQNPNVIYQSIGDGKNIGILKSEDRGETWLKIHDWLHPTAGLQFKDHIIWGLDKHPVAGFVWHDKETDETDIIYRLPKKHSGSVYDMACIHGIIYALFMSYPDQKWPATIYTSSDEGRTWKLLAEWPKIKGEGISLGGITDCGGYGYVLVSLPYGDSLRYDGTVRFPLPGMD